MPASAYIEGSAEQEKYGIPLATPLDIMRASSLVNHYLRRPKGCIWVPDQTGRPIYMAAANPTMSYALSSIIPTGNLVELVMPDYVGLDDSLLGDVLILDRLIPSKVEACIVQSYGPGKIVLKTVQFPHDGTTKPITIDRGLTIEEERSLPSQRAITKLAEWPIANMLSALGRYGYGRRSSQIMGGPTDINLLSTMGAFGGPPSWSPFAMPASSLNPSTGDLWVPAGMLLAYYSDIKAKYVGGWTKEGLPEDIKISTGLLVERINEAPFGPVVRRFNTGKISLERFSDTVLDRDITDGLRPYMANWMV